MGGREGDRLLRGVTTPHPAPPPLFFPPPHAAGVAMGRGVQRLGVGMVVIAAMFS